MQSENKSTKYVMKVIKNTIYLSMFAVLVLDLIMEGKINFEYILSWGLLLYFIDD
ncbi:hypothetical protein [Streptococcus suis]|uniref:hypothetical protein n=1 Tax=Streptococcus suis TaxID=1307 RepID=UPI0017806077|nr:hypothetical protein [Streptococcus suis]MBY4974415.1 hypothetical protein [Streptococcus suis]